MRLSVAGTSEAPWVRWPRAVHFSAHAQEPALPQDGVGGGAPQVSVWWALGRGPG